MAKSFNGKSFKPIIKKLPCPYPFLLIDYSSINYL